MENKNQEEVAADPPGAQKGTNLGVVPSINSSNATDLEQILKEKTFTRSEIDHLIELLNSKIVDVPSGVEERKFEVVPSTPIVSYGRHEESQKSPAQDGVSTHMVSTHVMNANVHDEDVASPAEIEKAYMGSRPPKTTPLNMVSHGKKFVDSFASGDTSNSSTLSLVPRPSSNVDVIDNGFITPRPRGRCALYSMARMPYSRVRAMPSMKNTVATTDAYRATPSSSSQPAWEQGRLLGSKQGALKCRSSVLDNKMGSVGPICRIRQKSNLVFSKGLSLPISGGSTSISVSGNGSETAQRFQSTKVHQLASSAGKALYPDEMKSNLSKMSAEFKNDMSPSSSFPRIPLRSSEMASKILEQLDKLTPPKEKSSEVKMFVRNNSPMKLSPSMLHGPALRSLEDVDSSKYLENVKDIPANDAQDRTSQRNDKFEESNLLKFKTPKDKSIATSDGMVSSKPTKDAVSSSGLPVSSVVPSSQTKWAFQMSAHEDFVDMDEEGYSNGPATDLSSGRREKVDGPLVAVSKPSDTETTAIDKPQASINVKPSTVSEMNKINGQGKSDAPLTTEKSPIFSFSTASSPSITANAVGSESALSSEKIVSSEVPKAATAPIFGFGDKSALQKELITSAPTFAFGNKVTTTPTNKQNDVSDVASEGNVAPTQPGPVPTTFKFGDKATFPVPVNAATENGNKSAGSPFKFLLPVVEEKESAKVGSASVFRAESSFSIPSFTVSKESTSDKADNKSSSAGPTVSTSENVFLSSVSTSTPTPSLFSFSSPSTASNLNNGSLAPTSSIFSSPVTSFSNSITNQNSSIKPSPTAATSSSETITSTGLSTSTPVPSFSAAPIFKFGSSSVPSTSASPLSAPTGVGSVETKATQETSTFGNLSGIPPSDTLAKVSSSSGSSVFQFGAASTTSDLKKRPENSTFVPGSVPAFGAAVSSASSGVAASTQSTPVMQFGSSSTSFGLTGNTGLSSGSSLFGSSAPASNLFSSGAGFGLASSSSAANNSSSGAGTSPSFFNWQPSSAPSFSTGFNSTPTGGFSFSLTSSSGASNSAPALFGSSAGASTAGIFSFTSAATAASSQPAIGNSNHAFTFGSTPPANNDQANMEDSMAEDTVQAVAPTTPSFGQQPLTPPSSGFVFGSTAPSLAASPFQFGGQQNVVPTPQNPSPFQASGSLDFNASAGGSFSLGAGGGDKANRKYVKVKSKSRKK